MVSAMKMLMPILLLAAAWPAPARAERFVIQSGSLSFDTGTPPLGGFEGEGLQLGGIFPSIASTPAPLFGCQPCPPGSLVETTIEFGGPAREFMLGQVTTAILGGASLIPSGTRPPDAFGTFRFDAPAVVVPDSLDIVLRLTSPFLFAGTLAVPGVLDIDLIGQGTVELVLDNSSGGYVFRGVSYTFDSSEPIPEPGTLFLVGSGVAALAAGRRRFRRDHK